MSLMKIYNMPWVSTPSTEVLLHTAPLLKTLSGNFFLSLWFSKAQCDYLLNPINENKLQRYVSRTL